MTSQTRAWNDDKPHRCPNCHIIVGTGKPPTWRAVYECCHCGVHFARWPFLAPLLPLRYCADHPPVDVPDGHGGNR